MTISRSTAVNSSAPHKIDSKAPSSPAGNSGISGGQRRTALLRKMHNDKFCVTAVADELGLTRVAIYMFLDGRYDKIGKKTRRRIWEFFVEHGWLTRPNRKPPVCRNCGEPYPTRKHPSSSCLLPPASSSPKGKQS